MGEKPRSSEDEQILEQEPETAEVIEARRKERSEKLRDFRRQIISESGMTPEQWDSVDGKAFKKWADNHEHPDKKQKPLSEEEISVFNAECQIMAKYHEIGEEYRAAMEKIGKEPYKKEDNVEKGLAEI